jgi:hypothetical protein
MTTNLRLPCSAVRLTALAALCVAATSCASLIRSSGDRGQSSGAMQLVRVTSEPAGATVFLHGHRVGVTPTVVQLKRRAGSQVLRLEKDGFHPFDLPVKRSLSPWLLANAPLALVGMLAGAQDPMDGEAKAKRAAVILPAFGIGLDLLTGAGFKLPSHVHATLRMQD